MNLVSSVEKTLLIFFWFVLVQAKGAEKCFTNVSNQLLFGHAQEVRQLPTVQMCQSACLQAQGYHCLSITYLTNKQQCMLNRQRVQKQPQWAVFSSDNLKGEYYENLCAPANPSAENTHSPPSALLRSFRETTVSDLQHPPIGGNTSPERMIPVLISPSRESVTVSGWQGVIESVLKRPTASSENRREHTTIVNPVLPPTRTYNGALSRTPPSDINFGDPVIDPSKGYAVNQIGQAVYWVGDGIYQAMFLVTESGVVLVDCPPTIGQGVAKAIAEITNKPVTHVIYSHNHRDHIGCASQFKKVEIIAHDHTKLVLSKRKDPNRPLPTTTFNDSWNRTIGGKRINLKFYGPNHTPDNIFIYLPDDRILFFVDVIYATWTPYYNLGIVEDLAGYLESVNIILNNYDWDVFLAGHISRAGTRQDLEVSREFINDLLAAGKQANSGMAATFKAAYQQFPATNETWLRFDNANTELANECERILLEKWRGRMDIRGITKGGFLHTYCYYITQAQNIDIGNIGSIDELNTGVGYES